MSGGKVLIADDDHVVRDALRDLLVESGFEVVGEATDGQQAITLASELEPDVVVMDMRMPVMDGIKATGEIRRRLPRVQVVMLSAYEDPGFKRSSEEAGAFGYLVKGSGVRQLRDVVVAAVAAARER